MILLIGTDDANLFHVSRTVSRTLSIMIANDKVSISEYFKCQICNGRLTTKSCPDDDHLEPLGCWVGSHFVEQSAKHVM